MHRSLRIPGAGTVWHWHASRRTKIVVLAILAAASIIALGWAALHVLVWAVTFD